MGVEAYDLWRDNLSLSLNLSLWIRDDRQPLLSRAYRINVTIRGRVRICGRIAEKLSKKYKQRCVQKMVKVLTI